MNVLPEAAPQFATPANWDARLRAGAALQGSLSATQTPVNWAHLPSACIMPKISAQQLGVLIHVLDGWEQNGAAWAPATNGPGATDMSASLVFGANVAAGGAIPLCAS